jgi:hypothetical protein
MRLAIAASAPLPSRATSPRTDAGDLLVVAPGQGRSEASALARNAAICASRPRLVADPVGRGEDRVHPGQNGPIFPAGQIPALARCPTEALADRDRLRAWGERSLEIVSSIRQTPTTAGPPPALGRVETPPAREAA